MVKIAVIGAGISGLVISKYLQSFEVFSIDIFEKHRLAGGRVASLTLDDYFFDFGAQFFTVRNKNFKKFLQPYIEKSIIKPWEANFIEFDRATAKRKYNWDTDYPHYIASPNIAEFPKALSESLDINYNVKISKIHKEGSSLYLYNEAGEKIGSNYDYVITTIPAHQISSLTPNDLSYQKELNNIKMSPCYVLMLGLSNKAKIDFDAAHVKNSIISWMSLNSSKNKNFDKSLSIMSTNKWADENFDEDINLIEEKLYQEFKRITGVLDEPLFSKVKKWTYANSKNTLRQKFLFDEKNNIFSCGDWCINGRVESAFISAYELAKFLENKFNKN